MDVQQEIEATGVNAQVYVEANVEANVEEEKEEEEKDKDDGDSTLRLCSECRGIADWPSPFDSTERMCKECRFSKTITETAAKRDYKLKDDNLSELPVWVKSHRHYGASAIMRLYRIADIQQTALRLYGASDPVGIKTAIDATKKTSIAASTTKFSPEFLALWNRLKPGVERGQLAAFKRFKNIPNDLTAEQRELYIISGSQSALERYRRENALRAALIAAGLELRGDSRLCSQYIQNGDGDIDHIVSIMTNMKFLYEHTAYERIKDAIYEDLYRRREYDRDSYDCEWMSSEEISEEAQERAMSRYRGDISLVPPGLVAFLPTEKKSPNNKKNKSQNTKTTTA